MSAIDYRKLAYDTYDQIMALENDILDFSLEIKKHKDKKPGRILSEIDRRLTEIRHRMMAVESGNKR